MILCKKKTDFNDIMVTQEANIITLWSPSTIRQTVIDIDNPIFPYLEYARNFLLCLSFCPNPKSILVLGLGGGSIPVMFNHLCREAYIDVVEIDPEMQLIAKKYFNFFTSSRLQLFIDDAFLFIKNTKKIYDIIIMDAYIGDKLPRPLSTTDFLLEAKMHLSAKGIFTSNLMTGDKVYFNDMIKKIGFVFKDVWLLPGKKSGNTLVFAMNEEISKFEIMTQSISQIVKKLIERQGKIHFDFQIVKLARRLERVKSR